MSRILGIFSTFLAIRFWRALMKSSLTAAYGMYPPSIALPEVVHTLNRAGFNNEDICMVLSPGHPVAAVVRDSRIASAEKESSALGTIGWVSEFGAVVIPTVGLFIRSQVFFHALMAAQDFPCGESRTLVGLGFPEGEARRLSHQVSDIGAMVYVSCPESARADWAIELLRRTGAHEVAALETTKAAGAAA
jgi:hypothetical protein